MSERDVRFDASAQVHLRDNGLLSLLLADNGIATLPRDIGDGRTSSVARGRSGDVSTGVRFGYRRSQAPNDVGRQPLPVLYPTDRGRHLGCPLKPSQVRTGLERLAYQPPECVTTGTRRGPQPPDPMFTSNLERQRLHGVS